MQKYRHASYGEARRYYTDVVLKYDGDECLIWPFSRNKDGYANIWWRGRMRGCSRLLCEEVNGPPPTQRHEAAHSCGKGTSGCIAKKHLCWKTAKANCADRLLHGTHVRGERCGKAKLTEAEARRVISLKGILPQREIAAMCGIARSTVSNIHRRVRWAWLDHGGVTNAE